MQDKQKRIRNFSIIAHIDHGKSTLADRLIEMTGALSTREMEAQVLDNMDIEKERGITIKSQAVKMNYTAKNGEQYEFNLIDTPGHVDFNYEVSRSLAACEGAILVVDSTQGVEAQTLANVYLALEDNLEIVPIINKVDLPNARPEEVKHEIEDIIGIPAMDAPCISAKTGLNVTVSEVGYFGAGEYIPTDKLVAGEVGYVAASVKTVSDLHVGDTITHKQNPTEEALPGYKQANSMVYCGMYPLDGSQYEALKDALEKLKLNDAALNYEPETSVALGFGFRCGFLGLLHLEIIIERLEREFDLGLITTAPSVIYKVTKTSGEEIELYNPIDLPPSTEIKFIEEPIMKSEIMIPKEFVGNVMEVCQNRRGNYIDMRYLDENRVTLEYDLPLNEIIYDFFDTIKSKTKGYASIDYEFKEYRKSELIKLDLHINNEPVDALTFIVHKDSAYERGRKMAEKLKKVIPRQLFEIPIQAVVGGKIIARETISAMRKDVLAKCYGGDITRKKKLLEKQKKGKKKMRQIGNVEVPQEAFLSVLKLNEEE